MLKPSDTRWLSHERCFKAIWKELTPLLQTLSQSYESSGDAGHMVYTPFWLVIMVHHAVISYQKFSVPLPQGGGRGGGDCT